MDIEDICTYGIVVKAPALADTHASASKQAPQLSPRAALPALCLSVYPLAKNQAIHY